MDNFRYLDQMLRSSTAAGEYQSLADYMKKLFDVKYPATNGLWDDSTWEEGEDETEYKTLLYNNAIIENSCFYENSPCLEDTKRHFEAWRDSKTSLGSPWVFWFIVCTNLYTETNCITFVVRSYPFLIKLLIGQLQSQVYSNECSEIRRKLPSDQEYDFVLWHSRLVRKRRLGLFERYARQRNIDQRKIVHFESTSVHRQERPFATVICIVLCRTTVTNETIQSYEFFPDC